VRLAAARIRDVRSVWGPPLDLPIGPHVTVLVGPNRAGSSNVAWAVMAALDDGLTFRPGRDLPRDHGRSAQARPRVELTWDDRRRTTVRWDRDSGVRHVEGWPVPDGPVVVSHIHETPRDVLRRLGTTIDLPADRPALTRTIRDTCRRVVPEVAEVTIGDDLVVEVLDDLGTPLPVPEVRALATIGIARHLATGGATPAATLVEAPGAFLHPAAQETVARLLVEVAVETGAPVLVTTSSPFAIPRVAEATVVSLARDTTGRTGLVGSARGDETQARLLGGLLRDNGLAAVLDRVGEVAPGTRGVLIVEGGTDEAYLRLAAERLGRPDALDGLVIRPAGGAMAAALAAVVLRAETDVPLLVLLDHDDPGRRARDTLVSRFRFDRSREVLTYADVFEGGPLGVEAETLFDVGLVRRFVRERGPSAARGERRLHTLEHVDLTSSGKSAFVGWLRAHADPEHLTRWGLLLDLLTARFPPGDGTAGGGSRP
jgi:hypothetical protein